MPSVTEACLFGIAGLLLLKLTIDYFHSPLRSVPGPFLARFTKLWYLHRVWNGQFHHENIELHRKHGRVVRYAPGRYSISDPAALKTIYGLGQAFNKSNWYEAWTPPGRPSLFTIQDNKLHATVRRKYQTTYTMSSMVTYEAFVDECTKIFRKRLEEKGESRQVVNFAWWFNCYATDTVAMVSFGKRLGCLDAGEDVGDLAKTLHSGLTYASTVGIYAEIHGLIWNTMGAISDLGLSKGTPRMYVGKVTEESIAERRKLRASGEKSDVEASGDSEQTTPKDFMDKFLDFNEQDPERFQHVDVIRGLASNVVAGADTTAATLSGILYWLLKYPSTLERLRTEVDEGKATGKLSNPITFKQAQEMSYLQAVIQEAQRLHPAVGLPLERIVPPAGTELCGHFFPGGSIVGVNAWVLHYDTSIFGSDAAEFRPERWLDADKETLAHMNQSYLPFGLGSRTCKSPASHVKHRILLTDWIRHRQERQPAGDEQAHSRAGTQR